MHILWRSPRRKYKKTGPLRVFYCVRGAFVASDFPATVCHNDGLLADYETSSIDTRDADGRVRPLFSRSIGKIHRVAGEGY